MSSIPRAFALVLVAIGAVSATAENTKPTVVLVERDPWLIVIGSDSPTFALYSDGHVIARNAETSAYVSTRLPAAEQKELLGRIAPESFLELDEHYSASDRTDQPTNQLHVWIDGKRKSVSVYGPLRREKEARDRTPPVFLQAFDAIVKIAPQTSPWTPELIEVLIWPYEHSPMEPLSWPDSWPNFESATPRGSEGLHQLFLSGTELDKLQQFVRSLGPKQAVSLGGRKWAISYRLPFPNEEAWSR